MNLNDLTPVEKAFVLNHRLENLHTSFNRSGNVLNMFQMKNGDVSLSISNEEDKQAISISLGDKECDELFSLLKQRYELKKQLNVIANTRNVSLCKGNKPF